MTEQVYFGRGNSELYDEYIDFINYVFGFNGNSHDFKKLLPKLYRRELNPAASNYLAVENGKIKAAIGAYDVDLNVCGTTIRTRGIGNVAVHPYARSRGYMKKLLNEAIDDMVKDGIAFSALGGRRHRYNYFSYDKIGIKVSMTLNSENIRYKFGDERSHFFSFRNIKTEDTDVLNRIRKLSESQPFFCLRNNASYFDILTSWQSELYAGFCEDQFAGYAIIDDGDVSEILIETDFEEKLPVFCADLRDHIGKTLSFQLPAHLDSYIKMMLPYCEGYYVTYPEMFNVLDYRLVLEAFLSLKGTFSRLPDGEITFSIDGRARMENITISVKEGKVSVAHTAKNPFCDTLGHLEAMNLLFAPYSVERETLPDFARLWFPLPLFIYHADCV